MVSRHVVTLANSIVGVSVLAMPFCFKQCGIVLATLSLMVGAVMTRMVCYFLVKAAIMSRRRTYELLAWSTFGQTGKFMVEISIIGFLIGTLIAFMVVIGDLGPEILSEIFSMENNSSLRTIIMTALSLFVALPLGLLRNIDSLSSVSTASVLFYLFLLLKIFSEGIGPQLIKCMFLMSVVFSVPLVIFPCRVSLHSLIFKSVSTYHHVHDMSTNYIPESRMKFLTVTIVAFTLVIGIIIPNIELVLGLVGSTTGSIICIIFPSIMFVKVTSKSTTEKLVAQSIFCIGVVLMLLTTYATLYAAEQSQVNENIQEQIHMTENIVLLKPVVPIDSSMKSPISKLDEHEHIGQVQQIHVEYEPKIPEKMISNDNQRLQKVQSSPKVKINAENDERKLKDIPQPSSSGVKSVKEDAKEEAQAPHKDVKPLESKLTAEEHVVIPDLVKTSNKISSDKKEDEQLDKRIPDQSKKSETHDAAQKENLNLKKDAVVDDTKKEFVDKNVAEAFLKKLEEHQENQKKLIEEQKEILQELKDHHAQDVRDKLEKEKQKEEDTAINLPEGAGSDTVQNNNNEVKEGNQKIDVHVPKAADKLIKEQEKIIEKISENLEKENKNAQLLEKLEEGLNKEVRKAEKDNAKDSDPKVVAVIPPKDLPDLRNTSTNKQTGPESYKLSPKETLKGVDKERGVLVGSLGSSRRGSEPAGKVAEGPIVNKIQPVNVELRKEIRSQPDVKVANDNVSDKNVPLSNLIQQPDLKNNEKVELPAPRPSKKDISETKPKEKVDREI